MYVVVFEFWLQLRLKAHRIHRWLDHRWPGGLQIERYVTANE